MKQTKKAILACLIGNSIFGFSFLFSKVALGIVSPFVLLSIRFLTAFLVLNLLCLTGKCKISLRGKPVGLLLLLGLVQPVCYFICDGMNMKNIIRGGYLSGYRTYIISATGIISAVGAYLVGDSDLFVMLQSIFTLAGIYFLRKSNETKGNKNG